MEPQIKMVIMLMPDGQVNVEGIPNNKMIAYGILEVAHEAVANYFAQVANRMVQPATLIPFKPS